MKQSPKCKKEVSQMSLKYEQEGVQLVVRENSKNEDSDSEAIYENDIQMTAITNGESDCTFKPIKQTDYL